jgi:hypothetical protein
VDHDVRGNHEIGTDFKMMLNPKRKGAFRRVIDYFIGLRDQSPYWRLQAVAWGIILIVFVGSGVLFSVLALSAVFGGGSVSYQAMGSPGPVVFRHYTHMWFMEGKYKECKICHNKIFATQKYGTFVFRALQDTPARKVRIGLDTSTLFVPGTTLEDEVALVTYEIPRACGTCATGNCHDGKESFSRLDCLGCHQTK